MSKDKNVDVKLNRYNMCDAKHWYVSFYGITGKDQKFKHYGDAREYALTYAYEENITVND